jgi:hypothetical protein
MSLVTQIGGLTQSSGTGVTGQVDEAYVFLRVAQESDGFPPYFQRNLSISLKLNEPRL